MLIIKVGGGEKINWDYIAEDLKTLVGREKVILVHGGSVRRDKIAKMLKQGTRYITSPSGFVGAFTDQKAIEVLTMVYSGLINKEIVAKLQKHGINAVGLTGADGRIWLGKRKPNILSFEQGKTKLIQNMFTGKVEQVNTNLIRLLVENDYLPVITQPAISYEGELINTDNDRNIAVMARDLKVKKMLVLFEAPGLLKDLTDETSLIKIVKKDQLEAVAKYAQGRMRKKVLGAKEAILAGVEKIYWGDGRIKNPLVQALGGKGTQII